MITDELRALFPNLSEEELITAKENLDYYLLLAWEILVDAEGAGDSPLTNGNLTTSIETKVDSPKT